MAITINSATIHRVDKEHESKGPGSVTLRPRETQLPNNALLQGLCNSLLELYRKHAHSNGTLGIDPNDHRFTHELRSYLQKEKGFMNFTVAALGLIRDTMEHAFMATGGYALFLRYEVDGADFMIVVMLKMKAAAGIDDATLDLTETFNIDMDKLHEAAKVNLTRWQNGQEPHLTFIKGRGNDSISKYFRDALACTAYISAKEHTEQLIKAADDFIDGREDIPAQGKAKARIEMRKALHDCLIANKDIELPLETVAAAVHPADPERFIDHVKLRAEEIGFHIDAPAKPYPASVRKLQRLRAQFGSINVSFEVGDVQAERVRYDELSKALILQDPPQDIVERVKENAPPTE